MPQGGEPFASVPRVTVPGSLAWVPLGPSLAKSRPRSAWIQAAPILWENWVLETGYTLALGTL